MNFLKGSLFRRNTEPEELEPMEESGGGILAVWGSPGCGKTVTAVKIAKHLAAQKKNTVLLLCDMTAPMMPCICPPSELEVDKSLGSIFAAQHISVNLIKHNLTTIEDGSRELQLIRERDGRVTNSVVHTQTRDSENERQRIDQIALLDIALRFNPDIICVGEMRGPEANAAQEAARVGIAVLTTIHSNSSEGTYRRMVSLCKRAVDTPDDTLMGYVTEAYPIVVYCRQLENKQRRITNISECEILPDGSRRLHKLYEYHITDNHLEDNRFIIEGEHRKCEEISESLRRRFIENGMPLGELAQFVQGKEEDE